MKHAQEKESSDGEPNIDEESALSTARQILMIYRRVHHNFRHYHPIKLSNGNLPFRCNATSVNKYGVLSDRSIPSISSFIS